MWECFKCGHRTVAWQSDFDAEDCGYDGVGIVSYYSCQNCGAEYEVVQIEESDETED